jgi:mycothiol system anti-sigma-R factor
MSCGELHATPCSEVLGAVDLLIDGEINETSTVHNIEIHLEECLPCKSEMEHERVMHTLLHQVLSRSCLEQAPQELHDALAMQLKVLHSQPADFVTEYRRTEISIQVDEFGQIEHREVTIEHTQEFRLPPEN